MNTYTQGLGNGALGADRVAVVAGLRTPFTKASTALRALSSVDLATAVVKELMQRCELDPRLVTLCVYGQVVPTLDWLNIAREVVLRAGLPKNIDAFSVSRACATSIQAMTSAAEAILGGQHDVAIAGGADSMSNVPLGVSKPLTRALMEAQKGKTLLDRLEPFTKLSVKDIIPPMPGFSKEPTTNESMGEAAEKMAKLNGITRREQDQIALRSHLGAARAWKDGTFAAEVMRVIPPPFDTPVERDNLVRADTSLEALSKLPAVFDKRHGTITAGNASPLTDGASALLLMRASKARALGYDPIGYVKSWAYAAVDPGWQLLMGPVFAAPKALESSFAQDFESVIDAVARDEKIKADVEMIRKASSATEARDLARSGHQAIGRLATSIKPIVAAVHGAALGGGFEVALACQGRVLSDDEKTVLGLPEVQLGLLPGMNGLLRLAERAGLEVALDYGLTGKTLRPAKARSLGIADDVVPLPILRETAASLALALADGRAALRRQKVPANKALATALLEKNPLGRAVMFRQARQALLKKTAGHYPAPERILELLEVWAKSGFEAAREAEAKAFGELAVSDVAQRLMEIFFETTALKKDSGVDDVAVKPRKVEKIAVLGAGLMGAGIGYVTLNAGMAVRLKDREPVALGKGLKYVTDIFDERVKKRQLTRVEREQYLAKLTATTDYSGMNGADMVIEAVFEDLDIKQRVLRDVEEHAREGFIFASNTSSIPIAKIAAAARHPENVVGMHYFSPVHRMALLEVIATGQTSSEVVATAVAVGKRQGKTVIVVRDGAGFYTSRILGPYINEALWLLTEGVAIETIDEALTAWGWPVGPLTLLDEVGIDVAAHVGSTMIAAFGARFESPPAMAKLATDERQGKKNERGLYLYGRAAKKKGPLAALRKQRKRADDSVYPLLGLPVPDSGYSSYSSKKPAVPIEELQLRCSLQLINEAMHCQGEGILRSARDGDIGAIFGLGFPPFRGGPFRYVDSIGAASALRRIEGYAQRFGKRWTPAPALVELAKSGKRFHT